MKPTMNKTTTSKAIKGTSKAAVVQQSGKISQKASKDLLNGYRKK